MSDDQVLIERFLDNALSEADSAALQERLMAEPDLRLALGRALLTLAGLREVLQAQQRQRSKRVRRALAGGRAFRITFLRVAAAVLLVLLPLAWWQLGRSSPQVPDASPELATSHGIDGDLLAMDEAAQLEHLRQQAGQQRHEPLSATLLAPETTGDTALLFRHQAAAGLVRAAIVQGRVVDLLLAEETRSLALIQAGQEPALRQAAQTLAGQFASERQAGQVRLLAFRILPRGTPRDQALILISLNEDLQGRNRL